MRAGSSVQRHYDAGMRVLVLGGTRFIGRAIVEDLANAGHTVTVVHRGEREPDDLPAVAHIHLPRDGWTAEAAQLSAAEPDAVVDCMALSRDDARAAIASIPGDVHAVVLSSVDVYRAFASLNAARDTDAVPIDETSPLSDERYPRRSHGAAQEAYSKRDVEDEYLARGAIVLRLPATYGEHDYQRREEFILRRVRARRRHIPIGAGGFLWTRGWVRDIARGARLAAEHRETRGVVFNLGEERTWTIRLWAQRILDAAQSDADLVEVPDDVLPPDMSLSGGRLTQHVLISTAKARSVLGYTDSDGMTALRSSVGWHLRHPPDDADADFTADDAALERSLPPRQPV
jgi:nucleoside-diphosphate-sugar epimerase